MDYITAADMARTKRVDPKRFRAALRIANLSWHRHDQPWTVERGSAEHLQMQAVLAQLTNGRAPSPTARVLPPAQNHPTTRRRANSDEHYVLDLCDEVLGQAALRGHRFEFLRGDARPGSTGAMLPVDGYYPALKLVVEYCERQHTEAVPFFDRRPTVSGVGRGEQRTIYDQRRRDTLPQHGLCLVELRYDQFEHDARGRLRRVPANRDVVLQVMINLAGSEVSTQMSASLKCQNR